jgi:hypothetical protein
MTTERLYKRYMTALERVSGGGVWYDTGAVRLAFQLALTDAHDAGREDGLRNQAMINQEYCQQIDRLAEYLVKHGHGADDLIDLAPEAIVARAIWTIGNLVTANSRIDTGPQLAAWLAAHLDVVVDGSTPVEQAIGALTYYHDLVTAQQAALANAADAQRQLREQLRNALLRLTELDQRAGMLRQQREELEELYAARQIDLANERAAVDTLRQQNAQPPSAINASPNDNGNGAAPAVKQRRGKVAASNGNGAPTHDEARAKAFALIRELAVELGHSPKMNEFDANRADTGLATASAIAQRFGGNSWIAVVNAALTAEAG